MSNELVLRITSDPQMFRDGLLAWLPDAPADEVVNTRNQLVDVAGYVKRHSREAWAESLRAARLTEWEMAHRWPVNAQGVYRDDGRPDLLASKSANDVQWHRIYKVGRADREWLLLETDPKQLTQKAVLDRIPTVSSSGQPGRRPASPTVGEFSTIVADPPWQYDNTSTRGAAEDHYATMSIADLCDLTVNGEPVKALTTERAHLYLWVTAGHLPDAFEILDAWGFTYKTYLVWIKPQMGMGNYFRMGTELVLFGTKGGLITTTADTRNHFEVKRGRHSAKPLLFRSMVERNSPGPYLELFSRCRRDDMLTGCDCSRCLNGWTTWGNQS